MLTILNRKSTAEESRSETPGAGSQRWSQEEVPAQWLDKQVIYQ